ncbi:ParB N-terminal domain-containing protein [uncultured Corynebacterium sp.]|jgi:hypothetical protein|uniref:ParB N-terminal domain-containing protein n=1 Tax=uncultured Corynebacterium sp. TaxID=159447 RepID=UPI0028065001|nr:ParB N-terminal domain-containing protein [uncultured Corynebacterium sp.]
MVQIKGVSKHANFYPMLSEEALAELAADIKENGQQSPITVTADGVLLDGRNRLKACEIAGVEPRVTVHEGDDEGAFVRSSNERRHQSTGSRAMSTALSLQTDGYRRNGRWKRGSVDNGESSNSGEFGAWQFAMKCAGRVLDELPELAQSVIDGEVALDDAYRQANVKLKARKAEEQRRIEEARDEQKREDSAGRYFDNHEEAKAWLDEKPQGVFPTMREAYAAYMEHDRKARRIEAEKRRAEAEAKRVKQERLDRFGRFIEAFVNNFSVGLDMLTNPERDEILANLRDDLRAEYLQIESTYLKGRN